MGKYANLLYNIVIFAINSVATKLITFLLVPLYTAHLTQAEYGITDMSTTVINLVLPLATLSIGDAVLRFCYDDRENEKSYVTVGFSLVILSVLVVALLSPLLDMGAFGGVGRYKALFVAVYFVTAFQSFCSDSSRAVDNVKIIPIASTASSLTTAFAAWVMLSKLQIGIDGFFYSLLIGGAVGIAVYVLFGDWVKDVDLRHLKDIVPSFKAMAVYSLPLIPNALFWWVGTSVNRLILTGMLGIAASGLFAAASKIPSIINIAYTSFQQAWTLTAFQEFKQGGIERFYSSIFNILNRVLVIVVASVVFFSEFIATVLLKGSFYGAWIFVPVLALAFYFNALSAFFGTVYTSCMKTNFLFVTTLVGAVLVCALTPVLIMGMGTAGAACAMAVANLAVFVLRAVDSRKLLRVEIRIPFFISQVLLLVVLAIVVVNSAVPWWVSLLLYGVLATANAVGVLNELLSLLRRRRQV